MAKTNFLSRSYYRCTNGKCTVKKRVERSSADPSVVITTYEGQHCHHIGSFPRGGGVGAAASAAHIHRSVAAVALAEQMSPFISPQQLYALPRLYPQSSPSSETVVSPASTSISLQQLNGSGDEQRRTSFSPRVSSPARSPTTPSPAIAVEKAGGLLDDMVPHGVRHG